MSCKDAMEFCETLKDMEEMCVEIIGVALGKASQLILLLQLRIQTRLRLLPINHLQQHQSHHHTYLYLLLACLPPSRGGLCVFLSRY